MLIETLALKNIGPHKDTTIDFKAMDNIIAVTGSNGTGKTFLLEAIPAVLFGMFPTRPGSIYDRVTKGYKGDAIIEVSFVLDGKDYSACRTLKAGKKRPTAEATLSIKEEGAVEPIVIAGPKIDDFERVVENLLGDRETFLASIYSSQKNTGDLCDARPAERKIIFARILGLERFNKLSAIAKEQYFDLMRENKSSEASLSSAKIDHTSLKTEVNNLEDIREQLKTMEKDIHIDQGYLKVLLKSKEKCIGDAEKALAIDKQLETIIFDGKVLKEKIDTTKITLNSYNDLLSNEVLIKSSALELPRLRREEEAFTESREALRRCQQEQSSIKIHKKSYEDMLSNLNKQALLVKTLPDVEACKTCKLAAHAYDAVNEIEKVKQQISELIVKENSLAVPKYDVDKHDELIKRLDKVLSAEIKLGELTIAKKASDQLLVVLGELTTEKQQKAEQYTALIKEAGEYASIKGNLNRLEDNIDVINSKIESNQRMLTALNQIIGKKEQQFLDMKKIEKAMETMEKSVGINAKQAEITNALSTIFGVYGIQPLIIDSAKPQFEEIANKMLTLASDGRMQIRFDTQKVLKSGEVTESLDIIVTRDGFEQDVGEFSGGEQKLIKTIIRLTLSIYQTTHSDKKLQTIFIDEVFDNLDYENSEKLLKVLSELQDYFKKIILVSHNEELLRMVPSRINLSKTVDGTATEMMDTAETSFV